MTFAFASTLLLSGCANDTLVEEDELRAPVTAEAETPEPPPERPGTVNGVINGPRPGLQGARRAAHNTVERIEDHQRALEEQMEEDK